MVSVVEGVLVSEGEWDDADSGNSVDWDICDWDSCVDEDSAKEGSVDEDLVKGDSVDENLVIEESVKEDWLDRASVDENGGFSGVGVDGEGWIIADVTGVDTVDVSIEKKKRIDDSRNHCNKPDNTILKFLD